MVSVSTSTIGRLQMYPSLTPAIAKTMMWKGAVEHRRPKASWWNSNEAKLDMQTDPSNWPWCPCFLHPWIGSEWQKPVKSSHIEDWHTKYAALLHYSHLYKDNWNICWNTDRDIWIWISMYMIFMIKTATWSSFLSAHMITERHTVYRILIPLTSQKPRSSPRTGMQEVTSGICERLFSIIKLLNL